MPIGLAGWVYASYAEANGKKLMTNAEKETIKAELEILRGM